MQTPPSVRWIDGSAGELRRLGLEMAGNQLVHPKLKLSSQIKKLCCHGRKSFSFRGLPPFGWPADPRGALVTCCSWHAPFGHHARASEMDIASCADRFQYLSVTLL